MESKVYYCVDGVTVEGPITPQEGMELLDRGVLPQGTLFCSEGSQTWGHLNTRMLRMQQPRNLFVQEIAAADRQEMKPFKSMLFDILSPATSFKPSEVSSEEGALYENDAVVWELFAFLFVQADYHLLRKHQNLRTSLITALMGEFRQFSRPVLSDDDEDENGFDIVVYERMELYAELFGERAGIEQQFDALCTAMYVTQRNGKPVLGVAGLVDVIRKGETSRVRASTGLIISPRLKAALMVCLTKCLIAEKRLPSMWDQLDKVCHAIKKAL